jgi:hypothetical protein
MTPNHINFIQWHQAMGVAQQVCARIFRAGGSPADAMSAFGLPAREAQAHDWSKAVAAIARRVCGDRTRRVA